MTPLLIISTRACSAASSARSLDLCIRFVIRVALWTVGSIAHAFSGISATDILQMRGGIDMDLARIDATSHTTDMINIHALWNRANEQFMCCPVSFFGEFFAIHPKATVAASVQPCHPNPTAGFGHYFYVAHEAVNLIVERKLIIAHLLNYSGVAQ